METHQASLAELDERLHHVMLRDRRRLEQRLSGLARGRDHNRAAGLEALERELEAAERRIEARRAAVPQISYPPLPVSAAREEILAAVRDHQVVVLAGETGSGKTTQLPKICLELGRGIAGLIGHTQPRRLAARSVAERIAEELGSDLGQAVGYQVRFSDQSSDGTLVKLMTDGILLAEMQHDRLLDRYDTLIIDEAHERSLNIDFLLGYLKALLPRRPDLKVIITSATIDPQRFSRHFADAPVIEVSGRTFPVEVRYRPLVVDARMETEDEELDHLGDEPGLPDPTGRPMGAAERAAAPAETEPASADPVVRDQVQAVTEAVQELLGEGPGDILVFLSGEREIRDTADALTAALPEGTEIVPLYARLSAAEQHRVFAGHQGRRVVLATNVAETSLTVPGIRYVVDAGTARISRYSQRTKVQRLPIEAISQASARQRAGRCGRVADGICIRLYSQEDFEARPAFTDPEILRTNLASVILQMTSLGLGDVEAFPFVEPPDRRNIRDGIDLLLELGALDPVDRRLTPVGRQLAALPLDPRLGRTVLEADRNGCLRDVLVIAAGLSIQDPRERPAEHKQAAAEQHARFADETSDFLAYVNLWRYLGEQQKVMSGSAFRRMCRREHLSWLRIREWQDLHHQLRQVARSLDLSLSASEPDPASIHQSLLSGLLSHIGMRDADKRDYVGARGARFSVVPGSSLFKRTPRFVMTAELVETNRLWGRVVARIEPEWAEALAGHLVKRTYAEPHWERKRAAAVAFERVTLYGVPLVVRRKVDYARIDPALSRELFLRHGLVEGDWDTHHRFLADNRALLESVADLEQRARRRDVLVDDETLLAFYDERVPPDVVSARHFDSWWKQARQQTPDLLTFTTPMLVNEQAADINPGDYPDVWLQGDLRLPLTYEFRHGDTADGVSVRIPLEVLNRVSAAGFDWLVPGMRVPLLSALIKSLPKALRVRFVPAPDTARAVLAAVSPREEPLLDALERELRRRTGVVVSRADWQLDRVPDHLRMTFVIEGKGRIVAEGKDLPALQRQLAPTVQVVISSAAVDLERTGLRSWDVDTIAREVAAGPVKAYPALVDEGASVALRALGTPAEQQRAMRTGVRRLVLLTVPSPVKAVTGRLTLAGKLALSTSPHGSVAAVLEDCASAAVDDLVPEIPWDAAAFEAVQESVRGRLVEQVTSTVTQVQRVLEARQRVELRVQSLTAGHHAAAVEDVRAQVGRLVFAGFVTATGAGRLPALLRYLQAADRRLERLVDDPARDRRAMEQVGAVQREYDALAPTVTDAREPIRWMIEELRVSLFAPPMRTAYPVSEKRIYRAMDDL